MAYIGMKYPVWAPIDSEVVGQPVVYGAGMVVGEAVSATITLSRANARLDGDDHLSDSDNSVTGGTLSINVTTVANEKKAAIMGLAHDEQKGTYELTGDTSPYGGMGFVRTVRDKGEVSYEALWMHKVQIGVTSENASTKGEQLDFQTPVLEGQLLGVENDGSGKTKFIEYKSAATEAEAKQWLWTKANITEAANV